MERDLVPSRPSRVIMHFYCKTSGVGAGGDYVVMLDQPAIVGKKQRMVVTRLYGRWRGEAQISGRIRKGKVDGLGGGK